MSESVENSSAYVLAGNTSLGNQEFIGTGTNPALTLWLSNILQSSADIAFDFVGGVNRPRSSAVDAFEFGAYGENEYFVIIELPDWGDTANCFFNPEQERIQYSRT